MFLSRRLSLLAGIVVVAAVSDCNTPPTVCTADLRVGWSPQDTTIAVGATYTASLELLGCLGTKRLSDTITFTSSDEGVATVGRSTGLVRGLRPGAATITGSAKFYPVNVPFHVTVR